VCLRAAATTRPAVDRQRRSGWRQLHRRHRTLHRQRPRPLPWRRRRGLRRHLRGSHEHRASPVARTQQFGAMGRPRRPRAERCQRNTPAGSCRRGAPRLCPLPPGPRQQRRASPRSRIRARLSAAQGGPASTTCRESASGSKCMSDSIHQVAPASAIAARSTPSGFGRSHAELALPEMTTS
jgi:hypothetical protein